MTQDVHTVAHSTLLNCPSSAVEGATKTEIIIVKLKGSILFLQCLIIPTYKILSEF